MPTAAESVDGPQPVETVRWLNTTLQRFFQDFETRPDIKANVVAKLNDEFASFTYQSSVVVRGPRPPPPPPFSQIRPACARARGRARWAGEPCQTTQVATGRTRPGGPRPRTLCRSGSL